MGFFDNLKETAKNLGATIKEGADKAADKAKDIAETTKQKAAISEAERKIKDVYTEMGKNLLEQFPDKAKELFPEQIGKIDEFKAAIEKAKAIIASLADKAEEITDAVEDKVEDVKEDVADAVEDAKDAAEDKAEEIKDTVEEIIN